MTEFQWTEKKLNKIAEKIKKAAYFKLSRFRYENAEQIDEFQRRFIRAILEQQSSENKSQKSCFCQSTADILDEENKEKLRKQYEDEYFAVRQEHLDAQARVKETHKKEIQAHKDYLQKLWDAGL